MLPRASAAFYNNFRAIKIGASLLCMSMGSWLAAESPVEEADDMPFVRGALGAGLILVGWMMHPGTVGNQQVPAEQQRTLARGMFEDTFGSKNNALQWTGGRMISTLAMSTLTSSLTGDWSPLRGWVASGGSLIPYAADRAWGEFRMHRAHPFSGGKADAGAWAANYAVGSLLDTSAAMAGMGIDFMLRSMMTVKGAPADLTGEQAMLALLPMYMGSFAGQMVTGMIAAYDKRYPLDPLMAREAKGRPVIGFGDSPRVRMAAHLVRLAGRAVTRQQLGVPYSQQIIPVAVDAVSAFTMHRWTKSNANAFMGGLRMHEERAFATPGGDNFIGPPSQMVVIHIVPMSAHTFQTQPQVAAGVGSSPARILQPMAAMTPMEMKYGRNRPDTPSTSYSSSSNAHSSLSNSTSSSDNDLGNGPRPPRRPNS
jgi:hypothetical protein